MRLVTAFLIGAEQRAFLDHLARDVERQVGGIDEAADEAQIARQKLGLVGDEDAPDIELHAALAVGVEEVERARAGNEGKRGVFLPALGAEMDRQRRLVELAGDAAVEVGVVLGRDLGFRLGPQRGAVGESRSASAPGFSTIEIGTGTWPDCALTMPLQRVALGVGLARRPSDGARRGCRAPAHRRAATGADR